MEVQWCNKRLWAIHQNSLSLSILWQADIVPKNTLLKLNSTGKSHKLNVGQRLRLVDVVPSVAGHLGDRHTWSKVGLLLLGWLGVCGQLWPPACLTLVLSCGGWRQIIANPAPHLQLPSGFHHHWDNRTASTAAHMTFVLEASAVAQRGSARLKQKMKLTEWDSLCLHSIYMIVCIFLPQQTQKYLRCCLRYVFCLSSLGKSQWWHKQMKPVTQHHLWLCGNLQWSKDNAHNICVSFGKKKY